MSALKRLWREGDVADFTAFLGRVEAVQGTKFVFEKTRAPSDFDEKGIVSAEKEAGTALEFCAKVHKVIRFQ